MTGSILIVEDDPSLSTVLHRILTRLEMTV